MCLIELVRMDLAWKNLIQGRPVKVSWSYLRILTWVLRDRGFRAVFIYRLAHMAQRRGRRVIARMLERWLFRSCGAEIAASARIGGGLCLPHPQGAVIGADVEIGEMVTINQHVTLGGNFGKQGVDGRLRPCIQDWVWICAGSVVGGPIEVGEWAIIGANSVVTRSVPPFAIVQGAPARVIRFRPDKGQVFSE